MVLESENKKKVPLITQTIVLYYQRKQVRVGMSEDVCRIILLGCIGLHEHHEIDRHISNLSILIDLALIGNDSCRKDVVIGILQEIVECAVHRVVLTRLDFNRIGTHGSMVIYQVVHLSLLAVVVVEELVPMSPQLLCNDILIDGAEINAADIVEHRTDVIPIEQAGKQPHIIEVKFQQILLE